MGAAQSIGWLLQLDHAQFDKDMDNVKTRVQLISDKVQKIDKESMKGIEKRTEGLSGKILKVANTIVETIKSVGAAAIGIIKSAINVVYNVAKKAISLIGSAISATVGALTKALGMIASTINWLLGPVKGAMSSMWGSLLTAIGTMLKPFIHSFNQFIGPFVYVMMPLIQRWAIKMILWVLEGADALLTYIQDNLPLIESTLAKAWGWIQPALKESWAGIKKAGKFLYEQFSNEDSGFRVWLRGLIPFFNTLYTYVMKNTEVIWNYMSYQLFSPGSKLRLWLSDIWFDITVYYETLKGWVDYIYKQITTENSKLRTWLSEAWDTFKSGVNWFIEVIKDAYDVIMAMYDAYRFVIGKESLGDIKRMENNQKEIDATWLRAQDAQLQKYMRMQKEWDKASVDANERGIPVSAALGKYYGWDPKDFKTYGRLSAKFKDSTKIAEVTSAVAAAKNLEKINTQPESADDIRARLSAGRTTETPEEYTGGGLMSWGDASSAEGYDGSVGTGIKGFLSDIVSKVTAPRVSTPGSASTVTSQPSAVATVSHSAAQTKSDSLVSIMSDVRELLAQLVDISENNQLLTDPDFNAQSFRGGNER